MKFNVLKDVLRRKVAMANKRLARLEKNNMQDLPAYRYAKDMIGDRERMRFTSAGKDYNKLMQELAMVDNFLNSKTSKIREANKYLKGIAERVGIKYNRVSELPQKTKNFFELASKVEQYLKNVEGSYHAVGYEKVWETVSEYVQDNNIDLGAEDFDFEDYLDDLIKQSGYDNMADAMDLDDLDWFTIEWDKYK